MRLLVPARSSLAVVALCGAVAAGTSIRPDGRSHPPTPIADGAPGTERGAAPDGAVPRSRDATPGFFAGRLPAGFELGSPPVAAPRTSSVARRAAPRSMPQTAPQSAPRTAPQERPPTEPRGDCLELERRPGLPFHEFYFTRAIYNEGGGLRGWGRRGGSWAIDYPKADRQFMVMVDHLARMDLFPCANAVRLDDPEVRRFPFLYALEVGRMRLTQSEVRGLRDYLYAGGFLVIDDFWGTYEWANFEEEMRRVLPGRPIVEVPLDHPIFHAFYDIDEILQVPNVRQGERGGPTHERDGYVPHVRGIFDDHDRLMVVINFNTDLGDAWEWAESPYYPLQYSRFAAEMGLNMIVYGMSH